MHRTTSRLRRSLLALLATAASLAVLAGGATPAGAADPAAGSTATYDIQYGATGASLGTATVTRTSDGDQDLIVVEFTVPGGFDEAHLCVAPEAFEARVPPGQCPHKLVAEDGQEVGRFEIRVDPDEDVHLQLHVVVGNETAYAGWLDGDPFHGSIEVPVLSTPETVRCPEGMYLPEGEEVELDDDGEPTNCLPAPAPCPEDHQPIQDADPMDTTGDGVADTGCELEVVVPADCPEGMEPEGGEIVHDEAGRPTNCIATVVVPVTCPDGTTPTADLDGDGMIDARDCRTTAVLPEVVTPVVPVPIASPDQPATPVVPTLPVTPLVPATPATSAPTVDVLPAAEVVPTVVTVDNPQVTAVLGDQVVAGALPRTGAATPGLAAVGALLLAAGSVLTRAGRRTA